MKSVTRSLLFWLILSSGLAFWWPLEQTGFDPFASTGVLLWSLIVVTMFSLGTLVRSDELVPLRRHPWWVVLGVATQVLVMPAAAWLATLVIPMDQEIAVGVILVGCVPGAMASNVLTRTASGSVTYSVSLTTVATILSPLTVPLMLRLTLGERTDVSLMKSSLLLSVLVVLPTLLGCWIAHRSEFFRRSADRFAGTIASLALLWIIATVVAGNRHRLEQINASLLIALLMVNLLGYAAGYAVGAIARLPERLRRALTLEVGMQNAGLGTGIAVSLLGIDTLATIPTAAYTFGCMLTGTMLAVGWSRVGLPNESGEDG
ncbi:bile acid:sodium symporter family protein [Stieleria varia]|uniref:Sodium Bile acid symporter family protein n=1 Tax=Stieleria varia TaxID=2528005 RepID=A0A5C6AYU1_9BACT|nr:bile acid:sodium symporter family protein [Stieleria varia]TWU04571.1 Sodium Bile acid symporter family protein [Stieleria varia]